MNGEYSRAYSKSRKNKFWKNIIAKTNYEVEILLESDDYEFIKQKEIEFITLYGRRNLEKWTLVNLTNGGEGSIGLVHSEEVKKAQRERMVGRFVGEKNPNYNKKGVLSKNYGSKRGEDYKKRQSERLKRNTKNNDLVYYQNANKDTWFIDITMQ